MFWSAPVTDSKITGASRKKLLVCFWCIRYNYCMAPKDTCTLGHQRGRTEVRRAHDVVHPATTLFVGSRTRPLPLGRFLLSSTGFHLILALVVASVGLPQAPSVPQPLVVTLIGNENSEPSTPSGRLDRTRTRQSGAPDGPTQAAPPRIGSSPHPEAAGPLSTTEAMEPTTQDERIGGPKTVGMSASGSHAAGAGTPGAVAAGGLSLGPVLFGPDGDGEVGSGPASRGGAGRLDASLVAPLTPSVTIGSPQGGAGRGPAPTAGVGGWVGSGTAGGRFSAPNYGINPLPKYPLLAREKGYEGVVYLRVLVRVDGRVGQLAVDRSSGHEILDQAAVDSVKEWAFFPAKKGGKAVESWVLLPVKFALN